MRRIILILGLSIVVLACSKKDSTSYHVLIPINDSIKSLFFKPGSFWIFKSVNNGNIDCTYISETDQGIYYFYSGLGTTEDIQYYSNKYISASPNGKSNFMTRIELSRMLMNPNANYPWVKAPYLYTLDTGNWTFLPEKYKYFDSITIGNNTFHHIQECSFLSNSDSNSFFTDSKIGFIRKHIQVNSTIEHWDLIRWNIVK